jgi:hypothetical protein
MTNDKQFLDILAKYLFDLRAHLELHTRAEVFFVAECLG